MTDVKDSFIPLDTTVVQVRSLLNFMYALGYTLDRNAKTGRFVTEQAVHQGNRYISATTAVKMHNGQREDWNLDQETQIVYPSAIKMKMGFTPIGVRLAVCSKLVEKVKISVTRAGQIVTQDVMVKPLNFSVLELVEPTPQPAPAE